ncbi:MAG: TrmH family RNA methyltransferase [Christensenellales bacterium]|jgi:TrmH family RNA methyltransferase
MPALKKYSRKLEYSYAPGVFATIEAIKNRPEAVSRVLVSLKLEEDILKKLMSLCSASGVRIEEADKALSRISQRESFLSAAVFEKRQTIENTAKKHIVLHNPQDMGNIGTIMRSALGFGFCNIAIIKPSADPFDPKVVRAAMGAHFSLNIKEYENFEEYKKANINRVFYPFMLDGSMPLDEAEISPQENFALVFGNEGSGLPDEFANIGRAVRIPHSDKIDSLNLAVAAAIGMYKFK